MRTAFTRLSSLLMAALLAIPAARAEDLDVVNEHSLHSATLGGDLLDADLLTPVGGMHSTNWINGYPGWYASGDALFLHRNRSRDTLITVNDNGTIVDLTDDTPLLTGNDLTFNDFETGYRVTLGRSLGNGLALEGSFFQVDQWDSQAMVTTNGLLSGNPDAEALSPPFPFTSAIFDADPFYQAVQQIATYRSDLLSAEMNLKATWKHHQFLRSEFVGVRYVQLRENFELFSLDETTSIPTNGIGTYDVFTDNDLLGLQYGQELGFTVFSNVCVSSALKAGAFVNGAEQRTSIVSNAVRVVNIRDTEADVAFVGELNVNVSIKLNRMLSMRSGYNFLWMEGLALAPEQDFPSGLAGQANLNDNGGLFLHGFNVGIELAR